MIELRTFGALDLRAADGRELRPILAQPKRLALLVYLAAATPGPFHRRDALLGLLWPENDQAHARAALSRAVHYLRMHLGEGVLVGHGDDELGLDASVFSCDVVQFSDAVERGDFEAALELYRGDFLAGFFLHHEHEFELWVEATRAQLRERAAVAARTLSDCAEERGNLALALHWARHASTLAPYDEADLRRRIRLLDRTGDRGSAVDAYNHFAQRMSEELDIAPSDETRALIADLSSQEHVTAGATRDRPSEAEPLPSLLPRKGRVDASRIVAASIAFAALFGAFVYWFSAHGRASASAGRAPTARVLIAEFAPVGADSLLANAATYALRVDLARSPTLRIAGNATIVTALRHMRRAPDARLSAEIAREVAVRERIPAVVEGEIRQLGASYIVSATVVEASTSEVVYGTREVARDSTQIIRAIDVVSRTIRKYLDESLPPLKTEPGLYPATTASLAALRKHAQAADAYQKGDLERAAILFQEAINLDSTFALAYVGLTYSAGGSMSRRQLQQVVTRAYQLRTRLPDSERYAVEGNYYMTVSGDVPRAIDAFRKQTEAAKFAGERALYATLMDLLMLTGDFPAAEQVGWDARAHGPTPLNQALLVRTLYRQGKHSDATRELAKARQLYPAHPHFLEQKVLMASAGGRYAVADSLAAKLLTPGGDEPRVQYAVNAAVRGQLKRAVDQLRPLQDEAFVRGQRHEAIHYAIAIARVRALVSRTAALRDVDAQIARISVDSIDVLDAPYLDLARLYAELGEAAQARHYLTLYQTGAPANRRKTDRYAELRTRAAIALAEGNARAALAIELERRLLAGWMVELLDDCYLRGDERPELARAYDGAGDTLAALATYERYINAPSLDRTRLDALELGPALFRLAELYAGQGDHVRARQYYLRFAELWKDAEPGLQPKVRLARQRAAELVRK